MPCSLGNREKSCFKGLVKEKCRKSTPIWIKNPLDFDRVLRNLLR